MVNNSTLTIEDDIFYNDFLPALPKAAFLIMSRIIIPTNMLLAIFGNVCSLLALKRLSRKVNESKGPPTGQLSRDSKKQGYVYQYLIIINDLITLASAMGKYWFVLKQ